MFMPFNRLRDMCRKRIRMLQKQGYDFPCEELLAELEQIPDSYDGLFSFAKKLNPTKIRADFGYYEPDLIEEIRAARPAGAREEIPFRLHPVGMRDKVYGGVYGRMIGCLLGKPFEQNLTMEDIRAYLEPANAWPLQDYVPSRSSSRPRGICSSSINCTKEYITEMVQDDDINYLILGLQVLEQCGKGFTSQDMARLWLNNLPYGFTWSAEHSRYWLLAGALIDNYDALPEGDAWWALTTYLNDAEESIGAMIRGDAFGLVNPGRPWEAAQMAWRDGVMTHKKTGLYAEMWVAATVAAAFATHDPAEAIRIGIEQLPEKARYTEVLKEALEISLQESDWLKAYEKINARWGHLRHAGTLNESAGIINALIHSVGEDGFVDYETAICRTVMHGWDTDCSGATAGCIAGVLCGQRGISEKWQEPLNNTFSCSVACETETKIDRFAERMYQMSRIVCAK